MEAPGDHGPDVLEDVKNTQKVYLGMSENGVNIPNEIAIFHRDNDQQNHWVFRGTQHFQTNPLDILISISSAAVLRLWYNSM